MTLKLWSLFKLVAFYHQKWCRGGQVQKCYFATWNRYPLSRKCKGHIGKSIRCTHTHVRTHIYTHMYTYTSVFMHVYAHIHIHVYTHVCYMCLYMHICIYDLCLKQRVVPHLDTVKGFCTAKLRISRVKSSPLPHL